MTPEQLERAWAAGRITPLADRADAQQLQQALGSAGAEACLAELASRFGPGVIVGSGGSSGARRWCLQPLAHLQASVAATGSWLLAQGIEPGRCIHLNPLPLHHVSGLLPLLRCRQWGARHLQLAPALIKDTTALAAAVPAAELAQQASLLLSVVPTQLARLLEQPAGIAWLQHLSVIWVGGAPLPAGLAARARELGLRLAPCYGATETAAMVCVLPPESFLAGALGCGLPLGDVRLRTDPAEGALEIACDRLSPGWLERGRLVPLPRTADGWWRSGDAARLELAGWQIVGRLDGALHSGGETVFPEQIEQRLGALIAAAGLPVEALLLLPQPSDVWGEQVVALLRLADDTGSSGASVIEALEQLVRQLPASQRPKRWLLCPQLAPSTTGKWHRQRWQDWLQQQNPEPSV
ncbi:MAG: AMP-binding protein [Prochlorococcaceae cyanobacterium]